MSQKSDIWLLNPNDIYLDYRKMSTNQLEDKYKGTSISTIKNMLKRYNLETNREIINSDLSNKEIIFMYDSLLKREIKALSNGVLSGNNKTKYAINIFRYLINNVLTWSKQDIINSYSGKILDEYFYKGVLFAIKLNTYEILNLVFPEYEINPWELKISTVGNGFWNKEININKAIMWLKDKLLIDKKIDNINQCGKYGFDNIIDEYKLNGMRVQCFDSSIELFEKMYNCNYFRNEMLKINYTFEIKPILDIELNLNNNIYIIQEEYFKLNDVKKTLCNEIIRYCEENNKYPNEKDMSNKSGYISRSQYSKFFEEFRNIHRYITPLEYIDRNNKKQAKKENIKISNIVLKTKPSICKCIKCKKEKIFSNKYFTSDNNAKFGLSYTCKECDAEIAVIRRYNNLGIKIKRVNELSIGQWWEYLYKGTLNTLPKQFYTENNYPKLIRYIINKYLNINTKDGIIKYFTEQNIKKYKISNIVYKMGGKLQSLQLSFPEMNFIDENFNKYTEANIILVLDEFISKNNLTIENILKGKANFRNDKKMSALIAYMNNNKEQGLNDLLLWYFKEKHILHPTSKQKISIYDFNNKSNNFYEKEENRINNIKHYCENICEENILNVIDDTDKLKQWIFKYFKQSDITDIFSRYNKYYKGLYHLLIECYPQIEDDNILFEWEWTQCNNNDNKFLIQMLRDYVLYRMNDVVVDIVKDTPTYINIAYFNAIFPKMNKHIAKHRFKNYYEWLCLAFPEYKGNWKKEDFNIIVAKDGTELDSFEERDVYEYIQNNDIFKYIKPIGKSRSGKYTFKLDESYEYERFCPDFVIEYIYKDNKKIKLSKPIILEYYGMYDENNKYIVFKKYIKKTLVKEGYYKGKNDIYYIGIYPKDIKNNYEGLAKKLGSFYMENLLNIEENEYITA